MCESEMSRQSKSAKHVLNLQSVKNMRFGQRYIDSSSKYQPNLSDVLETDVVLND